MGEVSLSQSAPAKINLYLHVTGRRPDGYHELDSLVVFADVGDRIEVSPGEGLSLEISGPFGDDLAADDDNLVLRAARALAARTNRRANAHLHLVKNLPVASGIGGGSADAAATLKVLSQFWNIELDDADIHHVAHDVADNMDTARALSTLFKLWRDDLGDEMLSTIGLELGADVPVCLEGRPVFMGGIGEKLDLAPHLPPVWLVLVNPGVSVSTPTIFKARSGPFSKVDRFHNHPKDAAELANLLKQRQNDLSEPAIASLPEIQQALGILDQQNHVLLSRMSGSGATCFGMFETAQHAADAAAEISKQYPDWWCVAAEMLDLPIDF
ncbi:MAG: 4-(cytidine 5'-diphospho)-2-C-methyl-D-erythritol kinase [Magnetovibrio sp.]|nr:4-(cytidine 5'-diphospho)-2-C-methyl-D-erythritol kinase [Magnetovibrio sp.]